MLCAMHPAVPRVPHQAWCTEEALGAMLPRTVTASPMLLRLLI